MTYTDQIIKLMAHKSLPDEMVSVYELDSVQYLVLISSNDVVHLFLSLFRFE